VSNRGWGTGRGYWSFNAWNYDRLRTVNRGGKLLRDPINFGQNRLFTPAAEYDEAQPQVFVSWFWTAQINATFSQYSFTGQSVTFTSQKTGPFPADYKQLVSPTQLLVRYGFKPQGTLATGAFSLSVNAGFYSLTGEAITLAAARKLSTNAGLYSFVGETVTLARARKLIPATGFYALTGEALTFARTRKLIPATGFYSLTGEAITFAAARKISTNAGFYALTGEAATMAKTRLLTGNTGFYSLTGEAVTLSAARKAIPATGFFSLTGQVVTLTYAPVVTTGFRHDNYIFVAPTNLQVRYGFKPQGQSTKAIASVRGLYSFVGQAVTLTTTSAKVLTVAPGKYALSGEGISFTITMPISMGTYTLTGLDVIETRGRSLAAASGFYLETGKISTLAVAHKLSTNVGKYNLTGEDVTLARTGAKVLAVDTGKYALTGEPVTPKWAHQLSAAAGKYTLTGEVSSMVRARNLLAAPGFYVTTGEAITFKYNKGIVPAAGHYNLTGEDVTISVTGNFVLAVNTGLFSLSGKASTLARNRSTIPDAGKYSLTGKDLSVRWTHALAPATGFFFFRGKDGTFTLGSAIKILSTPNLLGDESTVSLNADDDTITLRGYTDTVNLDGDI